MKLENPVIGLFKFGKAEHIKSFVKRGHIYMNTVAFFRNKDGIHPHQADENEGVRYCTQANTFIFQMETPEGFKPMPTAGAVRMHFPNDETEEVNLFCMYAFRASHAKVDPRNSCFGDTYVAITEGDLFLNKLRGAIKDAGYEFTDNFVEYVDYNTYDGEMGYYRKFSDRAYQSEYRFMIISKLKKPLELYLGDLSSICHIGRVKDLPDNIKFDFQEREGSKRKVLKVRALTADHFGW